MAQTDLTGRRLRRKERKRLAAEHSPLPWRRAYRAAEEVLDQGMHLWKVVDNKTWVALTLLGPLNAVLVGLIANSEIFEVIPERERLAVLVGVVVYSLLVLAMFLLAITTFHPERPKPELPPPPPGDLDAPMGIRYYEDIVRRDLDDYQLAWQTVRRGQLVAEVAEQAHVVAVANRRKFRSLYRLFRGLQGLTALALVILGSIGWAVLFEGQSEQIRLKHGKLTIPALVHPSVLPSVATETGEAMGGRDWQRFPAIVDRTTREQIVALGDVHGAYDRLLRLLQAGAVVRADPKAPGGYAWAAGKRTLVSVGDLIDKGPQSLEVLDLMINLQRQAGAAGGEVIVVYGNHEAEFLAHPGKKKAIEFERELDQRGIDFHDVAAGRNAYGRFRLTLPPVARVNGWVFCHGGSTGGISLGQMGDRFRQEVDAGRWKSPFIVGEDSVLEARKWWKGGEDGKDLGALPARHIVFGHDPGAFPVKGKVQPHDDSGKIFLIDVGMTPVFNYSQGELMLIDRQGDTDVVTAVDAAGKRREVWRGPAAARS